LLSKMLLTEILDLASHLKEVAIKSKHYITEFLFFWPKRSAREFPDGNSLISGKLKMTTT